MSRNGSGTYSLPAGNPVVTNTTISSTWANTTLGDIANALTGSLATDGQTTATGNLQMGNNKIVNVANGTDSGDAVNYGQLLALGATGKIVQIVTATTGTAYTTSTSYVTTGHTATITPTSSSNKILIFISALLEQTNVYASGGTADVAIYKNGNNLVSGAVWQMIGSNSGSLYGSFSSTYLDSPATTSATTYAIYMKAENSGNVVYNTNGNAGQLILMEISQ